MDALRLLVITLLLVTLLIILGLWSPDDRGRSLLGAASV